MTPGSPYAVSAVTRRTAALSLLWALVGCGGGSGVAAPMDGRVTGNTLTSAATGTAYPLSLYLPPASAGAPATWPVIYVLDGESWFDTLVGIAEATQTRVLIVGVHTAGQRSRDFVPSNSCTNGGGGEAAYLDFVLHELVPFIERTVGGDPARRALFGHSHGGSFVLYAMFAQAPGQHAFRAYLASDSSVSCMPTTAAAWEADYAAAHPELPVRLHLSYATGGNYAANLNYGAVIAARRYVGLQAVYQPFPGSHSGIVPGVLAEALPFAVASAP